MVKKKHTTLKNPYIEDKSRREELIKSMLPRVREISYSIYSKFSHLEPSLELQDIVQIGVIGLLDAVTKFDTSKEVKFETYAEFRIRGAILDELRREDILPRYKREVVKRVDDAINKLSTKLMREPTEEEIAEELNMDVDDVFEALRHKDNSFYLSYSDVEPFLANIKDFFDPQLNTIKNELKEKLAKAIKKLSDKERLILSLYFYEELTLKEIGEILNISESRVSQIRSEAMKKLKRYFNELL